MKRHVTVFGESIFLSRVEGRGSHVEGRGSRVEGNIYFFLSFFFSNVTNRSSRESEACQPHSLH